MKHEASDRNARPRLHSSVLLRGAALEVSLLKVRRAAGDKESLC